METGKQGFVNVTVLDGSVSAQRERERMHVQAPLTTMFLHAMPAFPPHPQVHMVHPQAAPQESTALRLSMAPLCSKETLPFLTLHLPEGLQLHQQVSGLGAALSATRPKSAGKHKCPHCGRDCLKPSVLEKHLRCHTGERPYPCVTCGVSFKTQSNLYKHKRTQTHARLCSESEQSSLGSQDSLHSSRDTCNSSLSLDIHSEDSGSQGIEVSAQHTPAIISARSVLPPTGQVGPDTGWALQQAALVGLLLTPTNDLKVSLGQDAKTSEGRSDPEETKEGEKEKRLENEKPPLTQNRHLPLQRQEATLFSKQWESSISRGKSQQSHDSTDSGFGESSEHPWTSSTESCVESSLELHKQVDTTARIPTEPGPTAPETKASVSEQEQRKLEERISKLISENDAVVVDKHLENVRPRKTMLSKQGSIDLPMPYTYKDSFHFEIRTTRPSNLSWQRADRGGRQALYSSAPTQCSTSLEHAPLTRSSSLPFSVGIQQSERSGTSYPHHRDFITLARRGSSGLNYPAGFATNSVDQQVTNHRPLVRQGAVDCNPAPEGIALTASTEVCPNILSSDGDSADICGEPGSRKYRRKKTQKFAYNKWYMYGGGTFKKLYSTDNGAETGVLKARKSVTKLEHELSQGIQRRGSTVHKELVPSVGSATGSSSTVCHQSCLPANLPLVTCVNLHQTASHLHSLCSSIKSPLMKKISLSTLQPHVGSTNTCNADSTESSGSAAERVTHEGNHIDCVSPQQHCESHIPSERKKQRTDDNRCSLGTKVDSNTSTMLKAPVNGDGTCSSPSVMKTNRTYMSMSSFSKNPTTTKTSFLPKYQLKLPNTADPSSGSSTLTLNQPKGRISHNATCPISSYQVSTSMTTGEKDTSSSEKRCRDLFTLPSSHTHSKTSRLDSQSKSTSSEKATTHNRSALPITEQSHRARPTLAVVQRQAATNEASVESQPVTTTTAILQCQDAKPYTTLLHNKPFVDFTPNLSATTITASVQNLTAVSTQSQCPALSQAAALSDNIRITEELKPATIPCHIIPYSGSESAAQNVFHVRTADLQICLQIISDEQLALIEPQIEMQDQTLPSGLSNFSLVVEGSETRTNPKGSANEDQGYVNQAQESTNTDTGRNFTESPNQMDPRELSSSQSITVTEHSTVQTEKPVTVELVTPPTKTGQLSHCWHVSSALSDPLLHAGTYRHTLTQEQRNRGGVTASLTSWKGVKSAMSQAQEHLHPLCLLPEECPLPKRLINQTGLISEPLSGQQKLCLAATASPYPSTVVNSSSGNGLQKDVSKHKRLNQIATCNVGKHKTKHKTPEPDAFTLEGMHGESNLPLQACSGQWSNANSNVALPNKAPSFPHSQACDLPGEQDSKQTGAYNVSGLMELKPMSSEILSSCEMSLKHAGVEGIKVGALDKHLPLQDKSLCKSEDKTSSNHSDTQLIQFTPVPCSIQNDRPKDDPGFPLGNQGPGTGVVERGSPSGCSPQTQEEILSHRTPPWQPDSPDETPRDHQAAQEPAIPPMEKQQSMGEKEKKDGGGRSSRRDTVPEQGEGRMEAGGLHTQLKTDALKPEHYEEQYDADSLQNCGLSTQSHQPLSQMQAVSSCNSTQFPLQKTITSNNRQSPPGNIDTSIPNTSQLEMETDSSLFPQRLLQVDQRPGMKQRQQCQSETSLLCTTQPFHARETSPTGHGGSITTCYSSTLSSSKRPKTPSPLPVVKLDSPCSILVSQPDHVSLAPGGMTRDTHPGNSGPMDTFTQPCNTMNSAHILPGDKADRGELTAASVYTTLNNVSARQDSSSKYCSVLSTGQFYSYPLLTSGLRAVQSSVEDQEDTSSSDDDEGKLIIEL